MDWQTFQNSCCSLDSETNENGEIFAISAVFNDKTFQRKAPFNIQKTLAEFDDFAGDAAYLLGHNILDHGLPVCRSISSQFKFLSKLVRDSLNDPLADARLAVSLFHDQWQALQQQQAEVGLLDFYRYAFSGDSQFAGAFDLFERLTRIKAIGCAERSEAHQHQYVNAKAAWKETSCISRCKPSMERTNIRASTVC